MEQIESISRARADQRLKDIQSALATVSSAPKKHMLPRLVHLRQSFPAGTSFQRAHEIANRIRKIGMVEKQRLFVYIFEQSGMTTDELGKNFHMHARFYVKGKATDVSPGKVAKEVWRITKLIVALVRVRVRVRCRTRCAHRRTGFLPGAAEKAKKC